MAEVETARLLLRRWQEDDSGGRSLPAPVAGVRLRAVGRARQAARADNTASRRVMETCGLAFQEELTFKGAQVVWYAFDAADWYANQTAANH